MALAVVLLALTVGCTSGLSTYKAAPVVMSFNSVDVKLIPVGNSEYKYYDGFLIEIRNNTSVDVEINWNRTLYLNDGQTRGNFMFEGILYAERNHPKAADVINPGVAFKKKVWPTVLVRAIKLYQRYEWVHGHLHAGKHGVSLSLWIDGKEVRKAVEIEVVENPPA